ncbi:hypothetical protein GLOTRDRAFT_49759 [Gloeophyllum trabeum ATCC 11539]|uniref:TIGR02453 family protein n=1 Tax=Gloeophyllum trabeum (strain ATCC 11539 / FP-39264 / Madison 617) TaxID=670483 RepID=S7PSL2_GLOTA|nr:uncharacterized protein GLOTRDRAFT_49759 [Gloeophyllum trabeum ATCC 11539]EPQ50811.1 hypothetical protein GLOTRDRAFT_49759 [Gloeophyllum trabeum ATCC 11539]
MDSDDLDEFSEEEEEEEGARKRKRRVRSSRAKKSPAKNASPRKKRRTTTQAGSDYEDEDALELAEGQEVVGVVVQAPKTGRVPPGQVSRNTLDFLRELARPECNDRGWFKLHGTFYTLPDAKQGGGGSDELMIEPVYRAAEQEWKDFVEAFTDLLVEADPQIPPLPPKDVIHRIYRDVRFSNDKTPYKTGFSASFSRSGRKGIFAHLNVAVKPNGESLIAAGAWCPGKNELQTIRNNIMRNPARLRAVISAPEFVGYFGEPRPHPKGARRSLWGFEDELKTAPKGVDKNHKDIDLLKLRTFAVIHRFPDEVVLEPGFREELARVVRVARPFVHCLNDMMTIPPDDDDDDNGSGGEEEGEEGDGEE